MGALLLLDKGQKGKLALASWGRGAACAVRRGAVG